MIASFHRQFPSFLSLSLFLVSSFLLSIHQFRKSFVAASSISKQRSSVELSRSQAVALRFEKCRGLCRCEDRERKKSNSERIASLTRFRIHMFSFSFSLSLSNEISISEFFHVTSRDASWRTRENYRRQINYKITRISRDSNISTRPNSRRFLEVSQGRRRWKSKRKRFFYWRSVINELFDRV